MLASTATTSTATKPRASHGERVNSQVNQPFTWPPVQRETRLLYQPYFEAEALDLRPSSPNLRTALATSRPLVHEFLATRSVSAPPCTHPKAYQRGQIAP